MPIPIHLERLRGMIEGFARGYGLDFFDVIFESVTFDEMNMIASYGGFPTRFPHWKWGMEYERLSKGYAFGLSKIYELVINNDPSYAYLMSSNTDLDQKLVMAHVYGHVDFFKNNFAFTNTNRKMMDVMANHGTKIRRYIDKYSHDVVETFIDRCLSIENLIDRQSLYIRRRDAPGTEVVELSSDESVPRFRVEREYMRGYINPKAYIAEQKQKIEDEREKRKRVPEHPEFDVMLFLIENAPLEDWQRDILAMLREEAYYFSPQGQTKIINEGWATFWHTTILTQKALNDSEVIDYACVHSGTMGVQPGSINPYKLGLELFRDIEDRWNKGRFGLEWEACDNRAERREWDKKVGLGREKIFEVRRHYNDVTFIDEFLTVDFALAQKLFVYDFNQKSHSWEILTHEFKKVKRKLLFQLTNFGQPFIAVIDANHDNKGELLLRHRHEGEDLRSDYMNDTLEHLAAIWRRPVCLMTRLNDKPVMVRHNGEKSEEKELGPDDVNW